MNRTNRIALMAAAVLVLVVTGTVFATRAPSAPGQPAQVTQEEEDAPPTDDEIAHAADRLRANEITVDDAVFNELATAYGVGGAVRIMAEARVRVTRPRVSSTPSGRANVTYITEYTAVTTPMPSASVTMEKIEKIGEAVKRRMAMRMEIEGSVYPGSSP